MSRRLKVPSGRRFGADDCAEAAFVGEQSAASLDVGLAAIARSGLPTLQGTWAALFGQAPPRGVSRRLSE